MIIKQTKSAGGVVINKKGQVVVVSQGGTSWSLPKGHTENNETPMDAAKREIQEESGITQLQFIKDLGNYQRYKISLDGSEDTSVIKTISMFLFSTNQKILKPRDCQETPDARWVDKTKVAELLTHKKDKEFFLKIMRWIDLTER
ncbi:NUDIX domain-containing protein [Candidatus Woesearchaeota archaeon]|nr:NUDIX domain-containing protein [Candidatus Woesearchaeota archaeon]